MKILVPIFILATCAMTAAGVALVLPASATNDIVALRSAIDFNASMQGYYSLSGKIERMEHEIDRLEVGFVALSVLAGSAITALCLLAARDAARKSRRTAEKLPAESPAAPAAAPERA